MKFKHRLGFFLGGFSIGLVFLAFFLKQKKQSLPMDPMTEFLKILTINPFSFLKMSEAL
jgi:hypothetical protein